VSVSAATGRIRWTTTRATNEQDSNDNVEPVVVGRTAYFAQGGMVTALGTSTGRSIWSWTGGQTVYGMWAWDGVFAVLTDQVSDHARLTGLDDLTGAVRWQLPISGTGLIGNPQATSDGGLAWLRSDGQVQVINLANGHVRWSVLEDTQAVPTAIDGLVLTGRNGVLHAFADQTGHRRWALASLPVDQFDQVVAGKVIVSSGVAGPSNPTAIKAVDPATGQVMWRFDLGTTVTVLSAGPAGLAVATYLPNRRLYLLDAGTGSILWQANTAVTLYTVPLVLSHGIVSVEGGVEGYPGFRLVDRDAQNGSMRWKVRLPGQPSGKQPVLRSGSLVVVEASNAAGRSLLSSYDQNTGQPAWRTVMPELVQIPPVLAGGVFLVQAATDYACAL
jgi:outer membrane protein assembly factor BamB